MKSINANFASQQTLDRVVWLCCTMPKHGRTQGDGRFNR
jgi:hypothetical protein